MGKNSDAEWFTAEETLALGNCRMCPQECGVNRFGDKRGVCGTGAGFHIASICLHLGEEPVIGGKAGICNVFFAGCNLSCSYCQNHQISCRSAAGSFPSMRPAEVLAEIEGILDHGAKAVGLVSPSHVFPQATVLLREIRRNFPEIVTVWNTNAYEFPENLKKLEGLVDVYLPDFKYHSAELAGRYSGASDYPRRALAAVSEMYRQKGSSLITDEEGQAVSGLLIRHLVLPGHSADSIKVLETIANELSPRVAISLMSQYYPPAGIERSGFPLRTLEAEEYGKVTGAFHRLGFTKGWLQEMESRLHYRPDFNRSHPFE